VTEDFARPLREQDVDPDPFVQFGRWFEDAAGSGVRAPEAAALATASADGAPSARMVLVKQTGRRGFVFFTNYESRKASELAETRRGALLFYWDPVGRQVRIEGPVERVPEDESAAYIRTRPRASQLSALASPQSRPLADRDQLERLVASLAAQYEGAELPVPGFWGGFRLTPERFEFWQHREDRLHDRLTYTPDPSGGWSIQRLAP
jgi:pyridoxamine 5'-phosphate oxidase